MKVRFLNKLQVEELNDNIWILCRDFRAQVDDIVIVVPEGYQTDFSSVPRLPLAYWLFGDVGHSSAVLHDYLYSEGGDADDKAYADEVLLAAMKAEGVAAWRRYPIYQAVNLFGRSHFKFKT